MAAGKSTLCPIETYRGLVLFLVINTAPITSLLSISSVYEPASVVFSGSCLPQSLDLAHPIVGISIMSPRCEAIPSRLGWAIPWPSTSKMSGLVDSFSKALISKGDSRKDKNPGTYGKHSVFSSVLTSTTSSPGYSKTTTAARAMPLDGDIDISAPAMNR